MVWNGIHHKTNTSGGPTQCVRGPAVALPLCAAQVALMSVLLLRSFGYPDPTYVDRLAEECAAHGVLLQD